jgi:two-component system KDP operon response regulator KdpE
MSRALELLVDRVLDAPPPSAPARQAAPIPCYDPGAWECTCLLIGVQGDLARRLVADFPRFGVRPVLVTDPESIVRFVRTWRFDAILIDARESDRTRPILLRAATGLTATPVLLLSESADEQEVIVELERGATDVVSTQTSSRLIATKLKRLARIAFESSQRAPAAAPPSTLQVGRLRLDLRNERAWVEDVALDLPGRSFAVLAVLAQHPNTVIDRTTLSLQLGASTVLNSRAFDMQISHIRAALGRAGAWDVVIDTVYRRGYRLGLRAAATSPDD